MKRAVLPMALLLASCATSGSSRLSPGLEGLGRRIYVSEHYSGYEARHIGEVVRTFEKHGFSPTRERSRADFYLDFSIKAGAFVYVDIALLKEGKPVVQVSSANYGWGTVIARPVAIGGRVSQAIQKLDRLLAASA